MRATIKYEYVCVLFGRTHSLFTHRWAEIEGSRRTETRAGSLSAPPASYSRARTLLIPARGGEVGVVAVKTPAAPTPNDLAIPNGLRVQFLRSDGGGGSVPRRESYRAPCGTRERICLNREAKSGYCCAFPVSTRLSGHTEVYAHTPAAHPTLRKIRPNPNSGESVFFAESPRARLTLPRETKQVISSIRHMSTKRTLGEILLLR